MDSPLVATTDTPATGVRCPHGRIVHWGEHGPDLPAGCDGRDVCVTCSPPFVALRGALERIRAMSGDTRVRRIADEALGRL